MSSFDALLDEYGRLLKAMQVLHVESDTDLPFDAWVETIGVRHDSWWRRLVSGL